MSERDYGFWRSLARVFVGHFPFSSFLGLVTVKGLIDLALWLDLRVTLAHKFSLAIVTGLIVAVVVWAVHRGKVRRLNLHVFPGNDRAYRRASLVSAFVCGMVVILAHESLVGLLSLTGVTLLAIVFSIKLFFHRVARLIRPGQFAHIRDVIFLIGVFATLLIAFTLVNYSVDKIYSEIAKSSDGKITGDAFTSIQEDLDTADSQSRDPAASKFRDPDPPKAQGPAKPSLSLLDYLYFSIVVMTTLGFGDISPIKSVAKISVGIQCVTSYVMFALMVGVITRGLIFKDHEAIKEEILEELEAERGEPEAEQ